MATSIDVQGKHYILYLLTHRSTKLLRFGDRKESKMFHQSELGRFAALLVCDKNGQIPEPGDDWREMEWGLDDLDSRDANMIELLDDIWWPQLVELASEVRKKVQALPEG